MRPFSLTTLLLAMLLSLTARAEPAVMRGGIVTVPEVLAQGAQGPALYQNVQLGRLPDGTFELLGWDTVPLARVESISVEQDQYPPGTVVVVTQVRKSMECVDVEPARVSRTGNTFHFVFVEQAPAENIRCMAGATPKMETFGIPAAGLEPGDYEIVYGELQVAFRMHAAP